MNLRKLLLLILLDVINAISFTKNQRNLDNDESDISAWINHIESHLATFNSLAAFFTWEMVLNSTDKLQKQAIELNIAQNKWRNDVCSSTIYRDQLTAEQSRKLTLLCRGPKFTEEIVPLHMMLMNEMATAYNIPICREDVAEGTWPIEPDLSSKECLSGEPDLELLMRRTSLSSDRLSAIWRLWHDAAGKQMRPLYPAFVFEQNLAAKANNYHDIGETWREELEISNLEQEVETLFREIEPLYALLHAVVRHKLLLKYGPLEVDSNGPIPIHLLGNMWGQDWSSLTSYFVPENASINLSAALKKKQWTVQDMVLQAEDMYTSLGLPPMTPEFWKYSIFEESKNTTMCHGTAANMYKSDDYRVILCANINMYDFYVIHHEMGHIQYYMAYENQDPIFKINVNSALQESIGDTIMHGVYSPIHLNRLGLLTDEELVDDGVDLYLLLQSALFKLPELPYAYMMDKYRWDIFNGRISPDIYNRIFWEMNRKMRGIVPPPDSFRDERTFDAGAKFHVPDNTPYIRYFLSNFIQMDVFKEFCNLTKFGIGDERTSNPATQLHRCDIYGCKQCGKRLLAVMQEGSARNFPDLLEQLIGKKRVESSTLLEYYEPLRKWLRNYIHYHDIPVGW